MARTDAEKKTMYETLQADLTSVAIRLKTFSEDADLFEDGVRSAEQESAWMYYQQLTEMIGNFAVNAGSIEE